MNRSIETWKSALSEASLAEVLKWARGQWPSDLVFASSFGAEDMVLIHEMAQLGLTIPVFTLDTGLLFGQTYALIEEIKRRYPVDIAVFRPQLTLQEQTDQYGEALWGKHPDVCCQLRKIEPLMRALNGQAAWITGVRREQSPTRQHMDVVQWDHKFELVKISPLVQWTENQVWDYLKSRDVPYNPLHDLGYPSIGCQPCTRAVKPGEDPRSGRWDGFDKKECGLHR